MGKYSDYLSDIKKNPVLLNEEIFCVCWMLWLNLLQHERNKFLFCLVDVSRYSVKIGMSKSSNG